MPALYTKCRKYGYGISSFTEYRECVVWLNSLFLLSFQCWHGLCIRYYKEFNIDSKNPVDNNVGIQIMRHQINPGRTITVALATILLCTAAIADTDATITVAADAAAEVASDQASRDRAEIATTVAAEQAIASVLSNTKLDLDIRLIGPTSTRIAGDR